MIGSTLIHYDILWSIMSIYVQYIIATTKRLPFYILCIPALFATLPRKNFPTLRSAHWPFRSMSSRNFWGTSRLWPAGRQRYWESAGSPKSCQVSHCKLKFIVIPFTKQLSFPLHMLQVNLIVTGFDGTGTIFSLGFVVIHSKERNIVKSLQTGVFQCSNCSQAACDFLLSSTWNVGWHSTCRNQICQKKISH